MRIRLNKYLAQCGLGSRRKVEYFILEKRISINGKIIDKVASFVDPATDIIAFDNKNIKPAAQHVYLILNKPKGYITSTIDVRGRPIVMDMIPEMFKRVGIFPVGRLDKDTEGLLLFTNDGDLAHKLNHPSYEIPKKYYVETDTPLDEAHKNRIQEGFFLRQLNMKTNPAAIEIINSLRKKLIIVIKEGKKRQIRYMFINLGYRVLKLRRIAYGPLKLENLHKGSYRLLRMKEVQQLKKSVQHGEHHIP